jgi:hypothetical protein
MSCLGLYIGPSVNQQLNHFAVAPFPILDYSPMQWIVARLILKIHVPALIEMLFDSRNISSVYDANHVTFIAA